MKYYIDFVRGIPTKWKNWLLILMFLGLMKLAGPNLWPPAVVEPVAARVTKVEFRLDTLKQEVQRDKEDTRQNFRSIQTWMCFQNRIDAIKSGIDCFNLIGPKEK